MRQAIRNCEDSLKPFSPRNTSKVLPRVGESRRRSCRTALPTGRRERRGVRGVRLPL